MSQIIRLSEPCYIRFSAYGLQCVLLNFEMCFTCPFGICSKVNAFSFAQCALCKGGRRNTTRQMFQVHVALLVVAMRLVHAYAN